MGNYTVISAYAHEPQPTPVIIEELPNDHQPAPGELVGKARYRTRSEDLAAGLQPVGRYRGDSTLQGLEQRLEKRDGEANGPQGYATTLLPDLRQQFRGYFVPRFEN